jgi:flavin-dependent dehydrogenase
VTRRYAFADGLIPGAPSAFEVDRAEFDHVLLKNAAKLGVEVREGWTVTRFDVTHEAAEVTARDEAGAESRLSARMVVDATGQASFLAGKLGMREMDSGLKNFAVFSHFEGAQRHEGKREGDITVVLVPGGWWWVIPLAGGLSVRSGQPACCAAENRTKRTSTNESPPRPTWPGGWQAPNGWRKCAPSPTIRT